MMTTIKGYYYNRQIILNETPSLTTRTDVLVTFLVDDSIVKSPFKRKLGGLEGMVNLPEDFNAPLNDLKDYM
jgi:hypothetical protein